MAERKKDPYNTDKKLALYRGELESENNITRSDFCSGGFTLSNVFTPEECSFYIKEAENAGLSSGEAGPAITRQDKKIRVVLHAPSVAACIWKRINPFLNSEVVDEQNNRWVAFDVHPFIRVLKYEPTGQFPKHKDCMCLSA